MSRPNLFFDSSALFPAFASDSGGARELLRLAEVGLITITVSEQVIAETERVFARKLPRKLAAYRELLRETNLQIVRDPSPEELARYEEMIRDPADVGIVVAAMKADVDYLVAHNRRRCLDDPSGAGKSGLAIGSPGDALAWLRWQFIQQED